MGSDEEEDFTQLQIEQNRKQKKAGGWQSLGLDHTVFKAIEKKGFKQPTPIQRKTIPCIMDGKDVVAMSRTGSGKTAAFVIPMLQRLKRRDTKGIRALLVSPTRELALQTFKVVKELGKFTGLRCACLVGGDAIEDQFSTIHENPDILLATPGRLLHVIVEMDLRLSFVQYVVFDEADRLFEMGFQDQLTETLKRIPESRQTLLFSATLPKMLVDFAKAGLTDPMLVRLDVDEKVSEKLSMVFCMCRPDEKLYALVHLCRRMDEENKQTVVFCATMKHVEYVVGILHRAGIDCSFVYSQLDAMARKMNIQKFHEKKNNILVVTDVAARGVDIPLLDTVINLHFPSKAKLYVHRVGRVARAGRSGTAISLIANDELPYLADLFLFLGKPMNFANDGSEYKEDETLIGRVPDSIVSLETEFFNSIHDNNEEMIDLRQKATNAMMKYIRTRPPPSAESARRVKQDIRENSTECAPHPFLKTSGDKQSSDILNRIANYKSRATIFEMNKSQKSQALAVMLQKRKAHESRIETVSEERRKLKEERKCVETVAEPNKTSAVMAEEEELANVFSTVIGATKVSETSEEAGKKKKKKVDRAEQMRMEREKHYIPYTAADHASERQLALDKVDFARQAEGASVDIIADDDRGMYKQQHGKRWDRKLKRYVGSSGDDPASKKIRTEDGTWLPASYKTGRYEEWKQKQRIGFKKNGEEEEGDGEEMDARKRKWKGSTGGPKHSELKNKDQMMKARRKQEKLRGYMEHRRQQNLKKKVSNVKAGGVRKGAKKSEPQTSFGRQEQQEQKNSQSSSSQQQQIEQAQQQQQHFQLIKNEMQQQNLQPQQNHDNTAAIMDRVNQIIGAAYQHDSSQFDSNFLLNGQQKFLPQVVGAQSQHQLNVMAMNGNGGLLANTPGQTKSKKKKGSGQGRRVTLDANGMPKERPFACPRLDCMKRFCRNDHLQRHMRIHTGQRLFQCRTCLRSFSRSDHLAKHERTHSADKPFSCLSCARRFHKLEEKKKHEDKCQHKVMSQGQNDEATNSQLGQLHGAQMPPHQLMYQQQMLLGASMQIPNSAASMMLPSASSRQSNNSHSNSPLEIRSLIAPNR